MTTGIIFVAFVVGRALDAERPPLTTSHNHLFSPSTSTTNPLFHVVNRIQLRKQQQSTRVGRVGTLAGEAIRPTPEPSHVSRPYQVVREPLNKLFLNPLGVRSVTFFLFLNPLAVCKAFFFVFAFHIPDHARHARSRRRASARRDEASLVRVLFYCFIWLAPDILQCMTQPHIKYLFVFPLGGT